MSFFSEDEEVYGRIVFQGKAVMKNDGVEFAQAMEKGKILVVDDNSGIRSALNILLPLHFSEIRLLSSPNRLMMEAASFRPDAVLLDMNFERDINTGNEGLYWLSELKKSFPELPVVLFTAYADINLAVEGMKRGAFDFIVKPWENEKLIGTLKMACIGHKTVPVSAFGKNEPTMLWGKSPVVSDIRNIVSKVAPTDATVLICGENGTGKDMLAKEIHRLSTRSSREMVSVDLGAVSESLFESELFGYVKGAFTDARSDHMGRFEQAQSGTLFLDEIGNIPLHLQSKLLGVLQNRTLTRLGDTRNIPVDIRLICATNKDLPRMVKEGGFREDLYYRINTVRIHLPPLRERRDEIMPLAERFREMFCLRYGRKAERFSPEASEVLCSSYWKGNIRELRNCIEKAVIVSEGASITEKDICLETELVPEQAFAEDDTLDNLEEKAIRSAMKRYRGNLSLVAKSLAISRPTLYAKLKKYGI